LQTAGSLLSWFKQAGEGVGEVVGSVVVGSEVAGTTQATKAAQNMCWSALITMPLMLQSGWLAIWVWTRHVHSASISGAVSAS
jgi:sensor histidine kinase regulating citrate/malate metabolism